MMVRPTSWLPLAVLLLLVGLTLWLNQLVQPSAARADGSHRHDPDLMVDNFNARKLGEDGRVLYTLEARKMVHYPDDDTAHLETVKLEAFEPKQPPMTVTADRGRLEHEGNRVWIEGNVVLVRAAEGKIGPAKLTTERMLVLPDDGIARTNTEVHLQTPDGRANAAALELDNHARVLRLERVHAVYQPAKPGAGSP